MYWRIGRVLPGPALRTHQGWILFPALILFMILPLRATGYMHFLIIILVQLRHRIVFLMNGMILQPNLYGQKYNPTKMDFMLAIVRPIKTSW